MNTIADRDLRHALLRANRQVREGRSPFPTHLNVTARRYLGDPHEEAVLPVWIGDPDQPVEMMQIWFRTRGCTFDRAGQCSMCNYGIGEEIDIDEIGTAVERVLSKVREGSFIYLSPSGSLLDDREVPAELRERLLARVADRKPIRFVFETRPETCTPERLDQVREALPDTTLVCQLGVESWDPEVRSLCHLKPAMQDPYLAVLPRLHERGFESIANVTLGGLGLSTREANDDTLTSVRGTRAAGFTTKMVFPLSPKPATLLGWAYDRGLWKPVSLWVLVRLLAACADEFPGPDGAGDLSVSWFNPEPGVVKARPGACAACRPMLVKALEQFRRSPKRSLLDQLLDWRDCDCPDRAAESLVAEPDGRGYRDRLAEIAERWESESAGAGGPDLLPLLDSR